MRSLTASICLSVLALLGSLCTVCRGEFFTSVSELETLLPMEGKLAKAIDKYVRAEEQRLEKIKRFGRVFQKFYDSAVGDAEAFLSHPVHAYLLVKYLSIDWFKALILIEDSKNIVANFFNERFRQKLKLPRNEDLRGAAMALIRLQETYSLNTTEIASGEFSGVTKSWELSAGDCYELGFQASLDYDFHYCRLWMKEALNKLETESKPTANILRVMGMLALSSYHTGKAKEARQIALKMLKESPNKSEIIGFLKAIDNYIKDVDAGLVPDAEKEIKVKSFRFNKPPLVLNYEKLCRGERLQKLEELSQLRCLYTSKNNSYLLLQPVKEEELSLNPRIVMYHDVISDKDMDILKQLAIPKLERSKVNSADTGDLKETNARIGKSAWLHDHAHPVVARGSRMIQDITGLSVTSAEKLHIINYGIGGYHEVHYDYFGEETEYLFGSPGNRLATWLYYLSDVEAGGYTVFPNIGVQVKPRKGSATFWYNLKKNGDGDENTAHAACPVLIGSKWAANKWIHETDNEFRKKCSLNREE